MVSIPPERASSYAYDLHDLYSPELAPILDVNLPPATQARVEDWWNGLDLGGVPQVPEWVQDINWTMDAVMAGYYHQRRVAEIEEAVVDSLSRAVAAVPRLQVPSNSNLRTMTLSYEYHAYLFAYRRAFEYLAIGLCGAFGLGGPDHINETADKIRTADSKYQAWIEPMALKIEEVGQRLNRTLAKGSPRNHTAHHRPIPAGHMRIWLDPDAEPRIGLEQGGEDLPMRDVATLEGERLGTVLERQLRELTQAIFELLMLLPQPAHQLDVERLR
jgi:hypothetical protein